MTVLRPANLSPTIPGSPAPGNEGLNAISKQVFGFKQARSASKLSGWAITRTCPSRNKCKTSLDSGAGYLVPIRTKGPGLASSTRRQVRLGVLHRDLPTLQSGLKLSRPNRLAEVVIHPCRKTLSRPPLRHRSIRGSTVRQDLEGGSAFSRNSKNVPRNNGQRRRTIGSLPSTVSSVARRLKVCAKYLALY
jgi:hypothetical protein